MYQSTYKCVKCTYKYNYEYIFTHKCENVLLLWYDIIIIFVFMFLNGITKPLKTSRHPEFGIRHQDFCKNII